MENVKVFSNNPVSDEILNKIRSILEQSKCPNESLRGSINRYAGISEDGLSIYLDSNGNNFKYIYGL